MPEKEASEFLGIFEMKNTLESLVMLIARNNDILKKDSLLYTRLVEDYKENLMQYEQFWSFYLEKYKNLLNENTQLSLDFKTKQIYIVSLKN